MGERLTNHQCEDCLHYSFITQREIAVDFSTIYRFNITENHSDSQNFIFTTHFLRFLFVSIMTQDISGSHVHKCFYVNGMRLVDNNRSEILVKCTTLVLHQGQKNPSPMHFLLRQITVEPCRSVFHRCCTRKAEQQRAQWKKPSGFDRAQYFV